MSRLSRANLKSRESVFAGGPEQYLGDAQASCPPSLEECVMAMEDCCEEVRQASTKLYQGLTERKAFEAQHLLRNGTKDLPRMARVLQNEKVFLLVNEGTVQKYQRDLIDEIEPTVAELISRAEQGLNALERKEALLKTKVDAAHSRSRPAAGVTTAAQKAEARKLNLLVKQRERLEEEARQMEKEIMELESKQLTQ